MTSKRIFLIPLIQILSIFILAAVLAGCGPAVAEFESVDYTPTNDLWPVSTPAEQGLDPDLVAELYYNASQLETAYSLLVFKNGYLVAEDYFHVGPPARR